VDEDDELTIVVTCAAGASGLERDGMLRRLEESVTMAIAEIAVQGYLTSGSADPDEVRLIIAAPGIAAADVLSLVGDKVADLINDPDAPGWGPFSVNVTDESDDDEDDEDDDGLSLHFSSDDEAVYRDFEDDGTELEAGEFGDEFDAQEAQDRLIRDAAHLDGVLEPQWLTALDLESGEAETRELAAAETVFVSGAIFQASVAVLDHLFTDVHTLRSQPYLATVGSSSGEVFFALDELPRRYAHRYDALFAQELIVATVDVTRRFTMGWEPLACVAQKLSLRLILDQAAVQLALAQVEITTGWRTQIDDALFEDLDHEMLYDASLDGIEDDAGALTDLNVTPLAFSEWFTPIEPGRTLPPYLLEDPEKEIVEDEQPEDEFPGDPLPDEGRPEE
jgi:hypothetical protein